MTQPASIKTFQSNIINPTFLRFNNIEILDFIIYHHTDRANTTSIFLSGRRDSWSWSTAHCYFPYSNTTTSATIDRRSTEPFVVCPLPDPEQKLVLNGTSAISMSLRIKDKNSPNGTLVSPTVIIPIYRRDRHNIAIYTMIKNKNYELIEWIEYHLMIGVEHFYLYNHLGSNNVEYFLRSYIQRNLVTIVHWPYEPLKDHYWNMMQSASMNHALKNFGPFNRWMGYFDVDEYFQIKNVPNSSLNKISLANLLDKHFPESQYPGGVQFKNCEISCLLTQADVASSRYTVLFEKCRHIQNKRDCQTRTKLFLRPKNVPLMQNIHALQYGAAYAHSGQSESFGEFRHYHYGAVTSDASKSGQLDTSMDIYIPDLRKRVITYTR